MIRLSRLAALSALAAVAGCASTPAPAPAPVVSAPVLAVVGTVARAEAALAPASASIASGRLVLVAEPGGVRISGTLGGLRPGLPAAFHVHERGDCSAVDASSAGGHFNPLGQPHNTEWSSMKKVPTETGYFNKKVGRYIYTKKGGWIDMTHFMFYAGQAYKYKTEGCKDPIGETIQDGYRQETADLFFAPHSAFSYEDLPTDKIAAIFGADFFDPNNEKT